MTDLVQKIREALAKITPWPWLYTPAHTAKYGKKWRGMVGNKDAIGQVGIIDNRENGNFIAHAPQWLSEAAEEIGRLQNWIREHGRHDYGCDAVEFTKGCSKCEILAPKETP